MQGGFAELFIASEDQCVPIPDSLSYPAAACAEPLAVTLHAVARAGSLLGRRVLITGAGPIGILTVAAVRLAGAAEIVITDLFDQPLAVAERLGATRVLNVKTAAADLEALPREAAISMRRSKPPEMFAAWRTASTPPNQGGGLSRWASFRWVTPDRL